MVTQNTALKALDLSGTFAGLMDLYERNYIGIRRLVPVIPPAGVCLISRVSGGLDLHLSVLERFPYTSELELTYHFQRQGQRLAEPQLRLRVYHDARLAEVMSAHLRHWPAFQAEGSEAYSQLYARWHVNRFLYKWLSYCLHQGHLFPSLD
ncbi:MAG: DUF1249 domain-containing protein [Candidatus Competibacteraceae bacterium]|nr:DUF1249 domain-containing protein [Candidatus Competibacteraceae bacterium]